MEDRLAGIDIQQISVALRTLQLLEKHWLFEKRVLEIIFKFVPDNYQQDYAYSRVGVDDCFKCESELSVTRDLTHNKNDLTSYRKGYFKRVGFPEVVLCEKCWNNLPRR